jgi:hypothetical protein
MSPELLQRDVRYAIRRVVRERTFAVTAVLILAIGIGASTAVSALVQACQCLTTSR